MSDSDMMDCQFALNILQLSCCDGTVSLRRKRDAQSMELVVLALLAVPAA